ncbi:hypothetical protein BCR39DRAFT_560766 [Naematelia encephala]|uniref:Uncharacterized protein n=1 Tax=Naematelia encephala TaxID=71784 RepID=A0A1Y2AUD8_9TREE|nr:hypothetical protein BCR39DRAFT_560766 [Naematelia encephala]
MPLELALPLDIVRRIASLLDTSLSHHTLSTLLLLNKDTYEALTPLLYRRLSISGPSSNALLDLNIPTDASGNLVTLEKEIRESRKDGTYFSPESPWRRIDSLRHARHVTIESLVSEPTSSRLLNTLSASTSSYSLFPSLRTVELRPTALDEIRTFVPPYSRSRSKPQTHPFLLLLAKSANPTHLCLSFPLVPSKYWEEHRDSTLVGQYQLVARLSRLKDDGWSGLRSVTVHNVVHQLLPSIPGCINTYHFSPHILASPPPPSISAPSPTSPPSLITAPLSSSPLPSATTPSSASPPSSTRVTAILIRGPKSVGQPGLQWNYRAWQIGQSIKSLFPSGVDASKVLEGTSWRFIGIRNHVLTKQWRDDDDESGVGYEEVEGLVRDCVKSGLNGDLPAREGFERSLVQDVWDRMTWVNEDEKDEKEAEKGNNVNCQACQRHGDEDLVLGSLNGIL